MPHSSGGGSSSGGGHSGSSSSSHSSSSGGGGGSYRNVEFSNHSFSGSKRCYVYYKHDEPHYLYADDDIRNHDTIFNWIFLRLFLLVFIVTIIFAFYMMFRDGFYVFDEPVKALKTNSEYVCTINDNAEILSESREEELQETLDKFMETTGIPVAFYTDYNNTWRSSYTNLIDYSYDLYVNNFEDEYHWVIVYTQAENDASDWYWEGMQGDYTDYVMDVFIDKFNNNTQKLLEKSNSDVAGVFIDSFELSTDKFANQHAKINFGVVAGELFAALIFGGILILLLHFFFKKPPKRLPCKRNELIEIKGKTNEKNTEPCKFCGKYYVVGLHDRCPYCHKNLSWSVPKDK